MLISSSMNYIDYYNNRHYQWHLAKLSPNEF
ncbi:MULTISPECIES: IS3 family transposase [Lachnospiraceae]